MSIMTLNAQTLHSLVFYGDNRSIGTVHDTKILQELGSKIAKSLQINHESLFISSDSANLEILRSKIDNMTLGSEDIVLFYYQGHGGRSKYDESKFPQLIFKSNPLTVVSANFIAQKLLEKKLVFICFYLIVVIHILNGYLHKKSIG